MLFFDAAREFLDRQPQPAQGAGKALRRLALGAEVGRLVVGAW